MLDRRRVQADFDRIARALGAAGTADVLQPCERALLDLLPVRCGSVLEVGCGHGVLTRHVALRADRVIALDLSAEMLQLASRRSGDHSNIHYLLADAAAAPLGDAEFDVIFSVAALHHLPLVPTVQRLAAAVRPGGWLLIQDVVDRGAPGYLLLNALAWAVRRLRAPAVSRPLAALYREHGADERYLTPGEVRRIYAELLPGSRAIHHLEWRYTVCWRKPRPGPG